MWGLQICVIRLWDSLVWRCMECPLGEDNEQIAGDPCVTTNVTIQRVRKNPYKTDLLINAEKVISEFCMMLHIC